MKRIILTIIGLSFLIISCDKNESETNEDSFNFTVLGKGLDCGNSFLLKVNEVNGDVVSNYSNTFYEINLPDEYKIEGKKIYIEFREPRNDEFMYCTNMGPSYTQIYITKVH